MRSQNTTPATMRRRPTPPPTAIPMMAPVDNAGEGDDGGAYVTELEVTLAPLMPKKAVKLLGKTEMPAARRALVAEFA